jgi:curli production assembly/transport component CsgF
MFSATMLRTGAGFLSGVRFPALAVAILVAAPSSAQAQEIVHRFINPSFGGNPFYSEHLLGIANIHRPNEPEEPAKPVPTEEDLLFQGIQTSLNAQASSQILDVIRNARPGQSGEFQFGNERISFTRSATETRITFVNIETGATRQIIVPVPAGNSSSALAANAAASGARSAEQALGGLGTVPNGPLSGGQQSTLLSPPPL